jgi:hypothetical protein
MGPFAYFPVAFDKDGNFADKSQLEAVIKAILQAPDAGGLTDLFVISHGWNNDIADAEDLYTKIFECFGVVLKQSNAVTDDVRKRRAAVVGILWPSKKFAEQDLTPGGAAGIADPELDAVQAIDTLAAFLDTDDAKNSLARAKALVPQLANSLDARDEFVRIVRTFMPHDANDEETVIPQDLFTLGGDELLRRLSRPDRALPPLGGGAGGAASGGSLSVATSTTGGAAGLGDWIGKAVDGAKSLACLVTYYQMKNRAGVVGQCGVFDMLRRIRSDRPADGPNALKLHLMGHSFGCRLITAAVAGPAPDSPPIPVDTMALMQAAFSHYGFAQNYDGMHDGYFRRVILDPVRVKGAMLITYTAKDKAVGLAYPIASRLARQVASALGDANDPYGGLGRNGAQKTPSAVGVTMGAVGSAYKFAPRGVYNLDANAIIGGHSDLAHNEVAWAILSSVCATT